MSRPSVAADAAAREQVLTSLARMFPAGTSDNLTAARNAACQMLAGGSEGMLTEVRLAALTIAFGFGALD